MFVPHVYNCGIYRQSVFHTKGLYKLDFEVIPLCLNKVKSEGNKEWVCRTCHKYLKDGKIPPCAIYNDLQFKEIPKQLQNLSSVEWRLVSPRLMFYKIQKAPSGDQYKCQGNVANVPASVCDTLQRLPRNVNELQTIHINLKRKLEYKTAVVSQNITPKNSIPDS